MPRDFVTHVHAYGVKYLEPDVSALYQDAARIIAADHGIAPVHLDAIWWGGARKTVESTGKKGGRTPAVGRFRGRR